MSTVSQLPDADPARRRRPFGVTVIAAIQIISAITWAAVVVLDRTDFLEIFGSLGYYEAIGPALAILSIGIAYGLITLRRRAWVLTMLWAGVILSVGLYGWWADEPNYGAMVLGVITVYYLNQREVQAAFHVPLAANWYSDE